MGREDEIITKRELEYPYSIPSDEMVARYEQFYTSVITDVMSNPKIDGYLGLPFSWLGPDIKCRTKELKRNAVAGFAFTIQWISDPLQDERDRPAEKMLSSYFENAILVVDTGRDPYGSYLGELNTNAMMRNKVRGSVIDGGARDSGFVKLMDFPVFCKFTSPIDAYPKQRLRGWHLPIMINGIRIEPMDVIVGDSDGVVVVPKQYAEAVLEKCEKLKKFEDDTRELIKSGMTPEEAAIKMGAKEL